MNLWENTWIDSKHSEIKQIASLIVTRKFRKIPTAFFRKVYFIFVINFFGFFRVQRMNSNFYNRQKISGIEKIPIKYLPRRHDTELADDSVLFTYNSERSWHISPRFSMIFFFNNGIVFVFTSFIQIRKWLGTRRQNDKTTFRVVIRNLKIHVVFSKRWANNISSDNNYVYTTWVFSSRKFRAAVFASVNNRR